MVSSINKPTDINALINSLTIDDTNEKQVVNAIINVMGASGSGKSQFACHVGEYLAKNLTPINTNGKMVVLDSENKSIYAYKSSNYKNNPNSYDFDPMPLPAHYNPMVLTAAIKMAVEKGYSTIVIDTFSKYWNGAGGFLEIVNKHVNKQGKPDSIGGWQKVTPILNELMNTITWASERSHVIVTARADSSIEQVTYTNYKGEQKTKWVEVPMKAQTRKNFKYEFNLVFKLDYEHLVTVDKCRPPFTPIDNLTFEKEGNDTARSYLDRISGIIASGLNGEDLTDLRSVDEIKKTLVDMCKTKQIDMNIIAYEVQKRGFNKLNDMPKDDVISVMNWFSENISYGAKSHPDLQTPEITKPEPEVIETATEIDPEETHNDNPEDDHEIEF